MTLWDRSIKQGTNVRVISFDKNGPYEERLQEMGIRVGSELMVMSRMPFGGPILIRLHSTFMALRQQEAACAQVELLT